MKTNNSSIAAWMMLLIIGTTLVLASARDLPSSGMPIAKHVCEKYHDTVWVECFLPRQCMLKGLLSKLPNLVTSLWHLGTHYALGPNVDESSHSAFSSIVVLLT